MTDSEKLRLLADWFDMRDRHAEILNTDQVQVDLRRIADELEGRLSEKDLAVCREKIKLAQKDLAEGVLLDPDARYWASQYATDMAFILGRKEENT